MITINQMVDEMLSRLSTMPSKTGRARALNYILEKIKPGLSAAMEKKVSRLILQGYDVDEALRISLVEFLSSITQEVIGGLGDSVMDWSSGEEAVDWSALKPPSNVGGGSQTSQKSGFNISGLLTGLSSSLSSLTTAGMSIFSGISEQREAQAQSAHERSMQTAAQQAQQTQAELQAQILAVQQAQQAQTQPLISTDTSGGGGISIGLLLAGGGVALALVTILLLGSKKK
jgi:hypothetical protein